MVYMDLRDFHERVQQFNKIPSKPDESVPTVGMF